MSSGKSEILHFDGLLLSKLCTVSAKKVQKSFMTLKSDEKFKEKLACCFKHDKEFGEFSPSHSKV